jgi:hypothetical protein
MQAQDAAGVTHGFSSLYGSDCNTGLVIRYFQGTGAGWTVEDTPFRGFVVATGGRWWAVWREHVAAGGGPGDEFDQTELFQAYTGGTYVPRERVTTNPSWDSAPSLALTPATTFPVRLVWARAPRTSAAARPTCAGPSATRTAAGRLPALLGHRDLTGRGYSELKPTRLSGCSSPTST